MNIAFVGNRLLLTPGGSDGFLVWEVPAGRLQRVIKAGAGAFAVSGDGSRCATVSFEGVMALWSTSDWKMLHSWKTGDGNVRLQLDRQGTRILTTSFFPGPVKVWDAQGKLIREFAGPFAAAISSDGKRVALGSGAGDGDGLKRPPPTEAQIPDSNLDEQFVAFVQEKKGAQEKPQAGEIKILDVDTGNVVRSIAAPKHGIRWLALRPDEKVIATADGQSVSLWDVDSGKEVHQLKGFGDAIFGLRFTSDGGTLSVGGVPSQSKRHIHLIDVATGKRRHEIDAVGNLTCDFSADGKTIAIAGAFSDLHLWDVATGKEMMPATNAAGPFIAIQGSPDGKSLLLAGKDRTIRRWDVAAKALGPPVKINLEGFGTKSPPLEGLDKKAPPGDDDDELPGQFFHGQFSRDGATFRVTSARPMKMIDAVTGQVKASIDLGGRGGQFSADGTKLVATGPDGAARIWDVASGRLVHTLKGPKKARSYQLSPDGRRLVVECNNNEGKPGFLVVFDVESGAELRKVDWSPEVSPPVAISADGKSFIAVRWEQSDEGPPKISIKIWDLDSLKEKRSFTAQSFGAALFAPDGKTLYGVGQDAILRVWNIEKGIETGSVPLGLQATGGSGNLCFVGPDRLACLNSMGTVTVVRLDRPVVAPKVAVSPPIESGPPRFVPIPAPKLDAPPGNLVLDDPLAAPAALDKFFHAGGQYGGGAVIEPPLGVRLGGGHSAPIAWAKPFLGDRYRVEFETQIKNKDAWAGWCLSGSGSGNSADSGYRCWINPSEFWFEREGQPAQQVTPLPKSIAPGAWVKVLAEVDGGKVLVVIDDTLVARFNDPSPLTGPLHGWFGLHAVEGVYRSLRIWSTAKDTNVARQLTPPVTQRPIPNGSLLYELKLADGKLGSEWQQSQPNAIKVKDGGVILHEGNASPELVLTKPLPANFLCEVEFEYASLPHEAVNFSVLLWRAKQAPKSAKDADGGWLVHLPAGDGKSAVRWHRGPDDAVEGVWSDAPILASTPYHAPTYKRKYVARIETQGDDIRVFLDGGLLLTAKKPAGAAGGLPVFLGLRQVFGGSTIHAVRVYGIPEA
jgi:WD40 repeat protein